MLQWLPAEPERKIIFNGRTGDKFGAQILDIFSGDNIVLPLPIYAPSPAGTGAVTLSFSRLERCRPVCGYVGVSDGSEGQDAPDDEGIWSMDLETSESHLIVDLAQLAELNVHESMRGVEHWVNHLQWNPSGSRFAFLHRWHRGERQFWTRLFTANTDGSDVVLLEDSGEASHYDWRDDEHVLAWSLHDGERHFHLYNEASREVEVYAADVLTEDGHNSYSPNREWLLTDTYPSGDMRNLMLYHPATNTRYDIGRFHSDQKITNEILCDLHPRWNRQGTMVCIDSIHEGTRQMYVLDVSSIVG